jgi:ethanolamine utilization protein EutN
VGTVISTNKNEKLTGCKFLIVEPMEQAAGSMAGGRIVAVDNVGAGISEIVLVATGSAARVGTGNESAPVDACVVGIVDGPDKIVIEE